MAKPLKCKACGGTHNNMKELQACHLKKKQANPVEVSAPPAAAVEAQETQGNKEAAPPEPLKANSYRKKPVVVPAFRMGIDPMPDWFMDQVTQNNIILSSDAPEDLHPEQRGDYKPWCKIKTLEGEMTGDCGDYIIQGVNGEIYPCKPDIFAKTYDPVEEDAPALPVTVAKEGKGQFIIPRKFLPEEAEYLSAGEYMSLQILGTLSEDGLEVEDVGRLRR